MSTRQFFSNDEKIMLQELIIKYKLNKSCTLLSNPNAKKIAWTRLTEEYNSIETNTKRTETQLKKCWENLKTRQKTILTNEKRQRMKTGGGIYTPVDTQPEILIPDALSQQTDVELSSVIDSDTLFTAEDIIIEMDVPQNETQGMVCENADSVPSVSNITLFEKDPVMDTPLRSTISRLTNNSEATASEPKKYRTNVIHEEFNPRKEAYTKTQERHDILQKFKLKESEWLVKAAEEAYHKARIEREAAEKVLKCNKIKTEMAQLELNNKNNNVFLFF